MSTQYCLTCISLEAKDDPQPALLLAAPVFRCSCCCCIAGCCARIELLPLKLLPVDMNWFVLPTPLLAAVRAA